MRNPFLWGYVALYAALLAYLVKFEAMELEEPLFVFFVLGVAFSLLAMFFTRGQRPDPARVKSPAAEFGFLCAWLVLLASYFVAARPLLDKAVTAQPMHEIVNAAFKLLLFVFLPGLALAKWQGYTLSDLAPMKFGWQELRPALFMAIVMLAFQAVFGRGLRDIKAAELSPATLAVAVPLAFLWLIPDVAIVEEFFFRALLQTRAARLAKSELGGIVIASVLFGLLHAPGLYLRTQGTGEALSAHPSLLSAIGYSFVITSVAGFFLGTLWARTRNFAVVVLVHAAADLLPNLVPIIKSWL